MPTIVDTAASHQQFTVFLAALRKTELVAVLSEQDPYTIFAPIDDAFDALPAGTVNRLLADTDKLSAILAYHIVPGRFTSADAARLSGGVTTLEGRDVRIAGTPPDLTVNGAHVVQADMLADNGVLHAIDQVLVPLDDLGNIVVDYQDVTVVDSGPIVVVTPNQDDADEDTDA
jgi:uncharacterized surface protein with fasciclin (FAS1) repeats